MANALYDKGREAFLNGWISWLNDGILAILVDSGSYTRNLTTDATLNDISSSAIFATSGSLTNKTSASGIADADDVTFSSVTGSQCEYVILYKNTGVATSSCLICCIDTATGLPVTPSGGSITVQWDSGNNKIFKL